MQSSDGTVPLRRIFPDSMRHHEGFKRREAGVWTRRLWRVMRDKPSREPGCDKAPPSERERSRLD